MGDLLVPILVVGILVIVYILSYALNKSTPIPEECLLIVDEATCESCHSFTCANKK